MSNQPEREVPQDGSTAEPQKRPLLPASRIVLLIILALAVAALILDWRARSAYEQSYEALQEATKRGGVQGKYLVKEDVVEYLEGDFERSVDKEGREKYTWTTLFGLRSYSLTVEYTGAVVAKVTGEGRKGQ